VPRVAEAKRLAELIGIAHRIVHTDEFEDPNYLRNDGSRCYHCKSELYGRIESLLPELGNPIICSGANLDDDGDYRPGLTAAREHAVRHPLQEAGFTKADVRSLAQFWGLPTWDKPASPCLSSRLAPGVEVTTERTARVEAAELYLRFARFPRLPRATASRRPGANRGSPRGLAALAVPGQREALAARFRELGFRFITLDLEGFRSGNLNVLVSLDQKRLFTKGA